MNRNSDEDNNQIHCLSMNGDNATNNVSSRSTSRIRSSRNSNLDVSIRKLDDTTLPTIANTGDIVQLADGTRKKYNGSSWRRLCSKPNCSYYSQSSGLCKPHLSAVKKRELNGSQDSTDETIESESSNRKQNEPQKGDVITLPNGIRKKFDGRQYRRICANSNCTTIVHGTLEHQNGLCPHHYNEQQTNTATVSDSSDESNDRKRRRVDSSIPKSNHRMSIAQIPATVDINNPKKGDIIQMENGSRKKFDGVVWRKICSMPDCFIAAQRDELCRKHFIKVNGKPVNSNSNEVLHSLSMVPQRTSSSLDISNSKNGRQTSMDFDQMSNFDDPQSDHFEADNVSTIDDDPVTTQIDNSLINALSASREKFPTQYLKKWLREHRSHPYPSNQEKLELAKQSSITYDQVTTWFNNARAILRRRQAKLRQSVDRSHNDEQEIDDQMESFAEENFQFETNSKFSPQSSLPLLNSICYRSIGVQCNPPTANQGTSISTELLNNDDEQIPNDRTIRIVRPSSPLLQSIASRRHINHDFLMNGIKAEAQDVLNGHKIIVTSTCLDDDQMTRLKEFCSRFNIEYYQTVDERTTHLITDEEDGDTLVCPLSKKVIQAVARHMYIVTYRWIDVCLQRNKIMNEKPYEIQGDLTLSSDHHGMQRSRQSVLPKNLPRNSLLENYLIMIKCDGCQEMMNTDELIELVQLSGANYTTDSHIARSQPGVTRIVLCEKEYLIDRKEMYEKCVHAGVHFLTPEWFLESLVQYRIQPFQEYQISP